MQDSDRCCGAAGSFCITHQAISEQISSKKAYNIVSTGADVVVTSCPSCKVGLTQGLLRINKNLPVLHIAELFNTRA